MIYAAVAVVLKEGRYAGNGWMMDDEYNSSCIMYPKNACVRAIGKSIIIIISILVIMVVVEFIVVCMLYLFSCFHLS